jgi:hypothetical protein
MNNPQSQPLYTLRHFVLSAGLGLAVCIGSAASAAEDPLPSWNEGRPKQAILEFVAAVTDENGKDYVLPTPPPIGSVPEALGPDRPFHGGSTTEIPHDFRNVGDRVPGDRSYFGGPIAAPVESTASPRDASHRKKGGNEETDIVARRKRKRIRASRVAGSVPDEAHYMRTGLFSGIRWKS